MACSRRRVKGRQRKYRTVQAQVVVQAYRANETRDGVSEIIYCKKKCKQLRRVEITKKGEIEASSALRATDEEVNGGGGLYKKTRTIDNESTP